MADNTTQEPKQKHAGGRPTKFQPSMIQEVIDYIEACKGDNPLDIVPSMIGFSLQSGIPVNTLNTWKQRDLTQTNWPRFEEFRQILDDLNSFQAQTMLNKGASRQIDSGIAKLVLGKHGYHNTTDITSNGESIKPSISIG